MYRRLVLSSPWKPFMTRRVYSHIPLKNIPINFTPNISSDHWRLLESAAKVIRCTDEISQENQFTSPLPTKQTLPYINRQHNSRHPQLQPFNVKLVDPRNKNLSRNRSRQGINDSNLSIRLKNFVLPYFHLSKPHLTFLVMLSSICSYALSPNSVSLLTLTSLTIGTTLCSASANAINMGREPEFDKQMARTKNRPVVRGLLSPKQAFRFSAITGLIGTGILQIGVNPIVAVLGASNIALYGWIYTSLKRKHIINTWVGGLVGAIPPLMGWGASSSLIDPGAWCLAGLLYAWQFPHFNTLSHNIKEQYKNAGYVMTAWKNPLLNARVALRYSFIMFPLCFGLSYYGIVDWWFQLDSGLINGWLTYWTYMFYRQQNKNYSNSINSTTLLQKENIQKGITLANSYAKKGFWCSIIHLPLILLLAIVHKKGRWDWLFEKKEDVKDENLDSSIVKS